MNKSAWVTLVASVLMIVGIIWAFFFRGDSRIKAAQQLQQQLAAPNLGEQQRRELWTQLRQQMEQLPPEAQRELRQAGRQHFQRRMVDRVVQLNALPLAQRNAELDKDIDRMEKMRAQWQKRRQQQASSGGSAGAGGGKQASSRQDRPSWRNMSDQDRNARRKERLDNSTPEFRGAMSEYRRMMQQRRNERGLPPGGGGPRF
jgi:hypothetical protein